MIYPNMVILMTFPRNLMIKQWMGQSTQFSKACTIEGLVGYTNIPRCWLKWPMAPRLKLKLPLGRRQCREVRRGPVANDCTKSLRGVYHVEKWRQMRRNNTSFRIGVACFASDPSNVFRTGVWYLVRPYQQHETSIPQFFLFYINLNVHADDKRINQHGTNYSVPMFSAGCLYTRISLPELAGPVRSLPASMCLVSLKRRSASF